MVKRAKAVDAKLVWDYETMLVPASDYDAIKSEFATVVERWKIYEKDSEARIRELEAVLKKYGRHISTCSNHDTDAALTDCSCGLMSALKTCSAPSDATAANRGGEHG